MKVNRKLNFYNNINKAKKVLFKSSGLFRNYILKYKIQGLVILVKFDQYDETVNTKSRYVI